MSAEVPRAPTANVPWPAAGPRRWSGGAAHVREDAPADLAGAPGVCGGLRLVAAAGPHAFMAPPRPRGIAPFAGDPGAATGLGRTRRGAAPDHGAAGEAAQCGRTR